MRVLGVIPARGGSKAIEKKNVKPLNGLPLIAYTLKAAQKSALLSRCIVSTDDPIIAQTAESFRGEVPFLRPAELATDLANAVPVMQHALQFAEEEEGQPYDALMMLQPTAPFRTPQDIDQSIRQLEHAPEAESVISVVDVHGHHPARMKFVEDQWLVDPSYCEDYENQPRQELPKVYIKNGAIYLTRHPTLMQGFLKGQKSLALEMDELYSPNIDRISDFVYAETLLQRGLVELEFLGD